MDYDIGKKHNLLEINILTDDGFMANNCGSFSGLKRFQARTKVLDALKSLGLFRGAVSNPMVIPVCRYFFKYLFF